MLPVIDHRITKNQVQNKKPASTYFLNPDLTTDEKIELINSVLQKVTNHFHVKADKGKKYFQIYKYTSIILAAITTIISSFHVIYANTFPHWILPIASAGATVAVAFLGASSAQKIWINSRTTQQKLQTEQFLFNQQAGKYFNIPKEESLRIFSETMIQIWNEGHGKWEQTVGDD